MCAVGCTAPTSVLPERLYRRQGDPHPLAVSPGPHRLREAGEQRRLGEILGVPLHGQHPRRVPFDGLDQVVLRPGGRTQAGGKVAHGLVMAAVHGRDGGAEGAVQQGARRDADVMVACLVLMVDRPGVLALEVLVERAARATLRIWM